MPHVTPAMLKEEAQVEGLAKVRHLRKVLRYMDRELARIDAIWMSGNPDART